jgi:hypothetical protein
MASSAWTATREDLVKELAKVRAEREIAIHRAQMLATEIESRKAIRRDWAQESRMRLRQQTEREVIQWTTEAHRLLDSGEVPPDPFAPAHRKTLSDALKGNTP